MFDIRHASTFRVNQSMMATRYLCIAVAGVTLSMLATTWSIHLVAILTAMGYTTATAIALGTLIGPAQVGARVLEMPGRRHLHPIWTMGASTSLTLLGFVGLSFGMPAAAAVDEGQRTVDRTFTQRLMDGVEMPA